MYPTTKALVADHRGSLIVGVAALVLLCVVVLSYQPAGEHSAGVSLWWAGLCAVSVVNVCCWRVSYSVLARRQSVAPSDISLFQWRQLLLSAVYVLGCAFRAIVPRADVQRIGLF